MALAAAKIGCQRHRQGGVRRTVTLFALASAGKPNTFGRIAAEVELVRLRGD
jgi:hypothetical protein